MPAADTGAMRTSVSKCGRFVIIDQLHLDRTVLQVLASWAAEHDVSIQDAIQLAVCAFNDQVSEQARARLGRESA
jgi:hypothetical protein